ncbi:hypothetical protein AB8810_12900 [Xanthomonas sp. NCPPB 3005]|uniref:hypothetical protein n=1 Tax=Xanthomonas sp. NCPPB 3005 TaxID=3240913 RepID=UPI0035164A5B
MAHAGIRQFAEPVTAGLLESTGEVEVVSGCVYIRMPAADAAELARQLAVAVELATSATLEA